MTLTYYVHDAATGEGVLASFNGFELVDYDDTVTAVDVPADAEWIGGPGSEATRRWVLRKVDEDYKPVGHGKHAHGHDSKTCQAWRCVNRRLGQYVQQWAGDAEASAYEWTREVA